VHKLGIVNLDLPTEELGFKGKLGSFASSKSSGQVYQYLLKQKKERIYRSRPNDESSEVECGLESFWTEPLQGNDGGVLERVGGITVLNQRHRLPDLNFSGRGRALSVLLWNKPNLQAPFSIYAV